MNLRQYRRYRLDLREHGRRRPVRTAGAISYVNWWEENEEEAWFTRFIRYHFPEYADPENEHLVKIRFCSVFGPPEVLDEPFDGVKIFFSGENLEECRCHPALAVNKGPVRALEERRDWYHSYGVGAADLSLGFVQEPEAVRRAPSSGTRYLRFPLWIPCLAAPEDGAEEIRARVDALNAVDLAGRLQAGPAGDKEVQTEEMAEMTGRKEKGRPGAGNESSVLPHGIACIASHDNYGMRSGICDGLEAAGLAVQYAGSWRRSTDVLKARYGDDKGAYLRSVRFNVCPENSDAQGYVTEKLFDAFLAGVIPIYQGALGNPEPEVIRPEAVLLWDYEGDNAQLLRQIRKIETDDLAWQEFLRRPRLTEHAPEYIRGRLSTLRDALADEIRRHGS